MAKIGNVLDNVVGSLHHSASHDDINFITLASHDDIKSPKIENPCENFIQLKARIFGGKFLFTLPFKCYVFPVLVLMTILIF